MLKIPANGIIREQINVLGRGAVNTHQALSLSGGPALDKYIPLTRGLYVLVDDDVYEWAAKFTWTAVQCKSKFYAARHTKSKGITTRHYLHRQILGLKPGDGKFTDHVNGNGLDCRCENLRVCTRTNNSCNKGPAKNAISGYKGLKWHSRTRKWNVAIRNDGITHSFGYYSSATEAALVRDIAALRIQGEYAWLNFPREVIVALDETLSATKAP